MDRRPLNSIMFLLIHDVLVNVHGGGFTGFKFHYVSINSYAFKYKFFNDLLSFKFHYVSINSRKMLRNNTSGVCFKFHYVSINSKLKNISNGEQTALNSIMFLLIHAIGYIKILPVSVFKFHYVSINSLMSLHLILLFSLL